MRVPKLCPVCRSSKVVTSWVRGPNGHVRLVFHCRNCGYVNVLWESREE